MFACNESEALPIERARHRCALYVLTGGYPYFYRVPRSYVSLEAIDTSVEDGRIIPFASSTGTNASAYTP